MNESQRPASLKEAVLEKIKSGEARMHSRRYFLARASLVFMGVVIVAATLIYLMSFAIVVFHLNGSEFAASLGPRAWPIVIMSFPWVIFLAIFIFIILLEFIVNRFSFAYRTPLLYSAIGIATVIFAAGFVVAGTTFHRGFYRFTRDHKVPFVAGLYQGYAVEQLRRVQSGQITETMSNGFLMDTPRGELLNVLLFPDTRVLPGTSLDRGDTVIVVGERTDHTLRAFGVREISDDFFRDIEHDVYPPFRVDKWIIK